MPPDDEPGKWQSLHEHANNVAELAAGFAAPFGAAELARWCGWLHDVGKYSDEFQNYLRDCDAAKRANKPSPAAGSAEHKCAGMLLAREFWPRVPWLEPIVTLAVLGHHGGLNSPSERDAKILEAKTRPDVRIAIERARADLAPELASSRPLAGADVPAIAQRLAAPAVQAVQELPERGGKSAEIEMLARFVFSCLVDADTLDTEAHFNPLLAEQRRAAPHTLADVGSDWQAKLVRSQNDLQAGANDTPVNRVRRAVYEDCLRAAERLGGVFTLTVPTGGGKTRSSLAFALKHGLLHGCSRIIYAAPYTTILDQTAGEFRKILGTTGVIEHHSAVEARVEGKEGRQPGADSQNQVEDAPEQQRRLATQNWDAPLIVTTSVQMYRDARKDMPRTVPSTLIRAALHGEPLPG
jgi:CRISPR-associated endonuclease/helicase Cas3